LTCQRYVRLDRDLGHSGGTGEQFRAGIQMAVDKRPRSSVWSSVMRVTDWTPSIVPNGHDQNYYLVINNYLFSKKEQPTWKEEANAWKKEFVLD